jgi:hypothetical protein
MSQFTGVSGLSPAEVLALIARNQDGGTAGIYDCRTILNEHRPVCTKEYHLVGKYLFGADNPDVWYPIAGAGGGGVVYNNRYLTLTSGTGEVSATRCVIDQGRFPIAANFIEVTCRIGATVNGAGGTNRLISFGFQPAFTRYYGTNESRAVFIRNSIGEWWVGGKKNSVLISNLPLGRNLAEGDICTVRLDRREGSPNIDIVRFYVNGQKQYETLNIPTENCYAGIGVFCDDACTTATSIAIDYFGVKYVP